MNPYATLGISKNASPQEIKKAYRKKARKLHPDVNPSNDAAEQFIAIKDAYEYILCDLSGGHKKGKAGHSHSRTRSSNTWHQPDPNKADIARFITNLEQLLARIAGPNNYNPAMTKLVQKYVSMTWSLELVTKINKHATHWQKHRIIELNFYLFDMLRVDHIKKVSACLKRIAGDDPALQKIVTKNKRSGTVNKLFWGCAMTIGALLLLFLIVIVLWTCYDIYYGIKYEPE